MNHIHIHTPRHNPFSLNLHALILSNSKPKITWNNALSVSNQNTKTQKSLGWHIPNPPLETDVLMHVHTQLMTGIIFIKNWQSQG